MKLGKYKFSVFKLHGSLSFRCYIWDRNLNKLFRAGFSVGKKNYIMLPETIELPELGWRR